MSGIPADAKTVGNFRDNVLKYGGIDLVTYQKIYSTGTHNGITYTWNSDGECTISGTATENSFNNIAGDVSTLLDGIIPGNTYHVDFHNGNIPIRIYWYNPETHYETHSESFDFTVPYDATAVLFRFQIGAGADFSTPVTVRYSIAIGGGGSGSGTKLTL